MSLDSLLTNMYNHDSKVSSLEKTAEDNMFSALQATGDVEENPYAEMSTADLATLALQLEEQEKVASAGGVQEEVEDLSELEKIAADKLGGEVMAHAMIHEFGSIKIAMANGFCRVCKENPMDVQGTSICSGCAGE